ncbi:helix-turn-helix domain-containing protein [Microbacterium testaceum]|uniref:helix-turn-helix transcriptional regulator n=1 Tax=Microbacterium testaceum TaxID=2033 RepID=UPI003432C6DF
MTITDPTAPLLTSKEVATMLVVSESTLSRWRESGDGPSFIRMGGIFRYTADDVAAFVKEHRA